MEIFVFDDVHPEDNAMMQALYSRSPKSVVEHVEKVKEVGSGKFMGSYYIGYGHASIGDCGSTTVYIENVSMLVAKAIQDTPLYSGQEASTRYLDFSKQALVDPYNHPYSKKILDRWMEVYNETLPIVEKALRARFPFNSEDYRSEKTWEKAVLARAFDTVRCLLPVATTTYVSWHTNLRQARDHLRRLSSHPLQEVRDVAKHVFDTLYEKYPNSFSGEELTSESERYAERNAYADAIALDNHFLDAEKEFAKLSDTDQTAVKAYDVAIDSSLMDIEGINKNEEAVLSTRPRGAPLPRHLGEYGRYKYSFLLDFGSYRDIQRHRNGLCRNPLVSDQFGFSTWYLDEMESLLSAEEFTKVTSAIHEQLEAIRNIANEIPEADKVRNQYLFPMGMACLVQLTYCLPQTVYVVDLRTGKPVHQSLRVPMQKIGRKMEENHPTLKLYADYDPDNWTTKRGEQDITEKKKAS